MSKKKTHRKQSTRPRSASQSVARPGAAPTREPVKVRRVSYQQRKKTQARFWRWAAFGLAALVVIAVGLTWLIASQKSTAAGVKISAAIAYQKYQAQAFFLDVRSQDEWRQMHIPNSTQIPLDELESRLTELPQEGEIVVVCLSGKRSQEGQQILIKAGFKDVFCLDGGLETWQAAGFPTESGM